MSASAKKQGRLLLTTVRFPPACCGVGDFTAHLAHTLRERGDDVLVLTEPGPGPRPSGIPTMEAPLRGWRSLPAVLRAIRSSEATHVQLEYSSYGWGRWGFSFAVNALAFALRLRGCALTLGLHELYLPLTVRPFELICGLIQRVHFALLFLAATEIVTNTPQRVRTVQRWLPWRADAVRFRPTASNIPVTTLTPGEREALRAERGAMAHAIVVAMFGSFHPAKNYEAVIEAVVQLRSRLPVQLWVLGDQQASREYVARLRRLAEPLGDAAFWPGLAPAEQVSACLQAADIFVLPQSDGHLTRSGSFMAAAAHGLPVIAVRNDAEQQHFCHGENVYLAQRGSADGFAAAVQQLAGNAHLRSQLGANLRQLYYSRFDWVHLLQSSREDRPYPVYWPGADSSSTVRSKE